MNDVKKIDRNKKNVSKRALVFWIAMVLLVIVAFVLIVIRVSQTKEINSYSKVDEVFGQNMFLQEENSYYVYFADLELNKENESLNKGLFQYLTYYRDKAGATKLYKMDSDNVSNSPCFTDSKSAEKLVGTSEFPNRVNTSSEYATPEKVFKVFGENLPILVLIKDGKVEVSKSGESEILSYLKEIMK